jgi:hypothetical protein
VTKESWWTDKVQENLSQGDVLEELPFLIPESPLKYLKHETLRGSREGWCASATPVPLPDGRIQIAGLGRKLPGIVLSHDCELDKSRETPRVIVAAVMPLNAVGRDQQEVILRQKHIAFMPLLDLPKLGTMMMNLRIIITLERKIVAAVPPVASMTEQAKKRLQAQLIQFFSRLDPETE